MKSITINVTQLDIDGGVRYNSRACPIANAVRRVSIPRDIEPIHVDNSYMMIGKTGYTLSKAAKAFIIDFDSYKKVKPFRFRSKEMKKKW